MGDLNNECCILIPNNNLSCIKLNLKNFESIFENEISVTNFKFLSFKTTIIVKLLSMDDFVELNKLKEYFPEHSELEINLYTNIIFKHWLNNFKIKLALCYGLLNKHLNYLKTKVSYFQIVQLLNQS